jgi:hypothetical protein
MPQAIRIRLTGVLSFFIAQSPQLIYIYTMIPDKEALPLNKLCRRVFK